jgi:hypothetical protein
VVLFSCIETNHFPCLFFVSFSPQNMFSEYILVFKIFPHSISDTHECISVQTFYFKSNTLLDCHQHQYTYIYNSVVDPGRGYSPSLNQEKYVLKINNFHYQGKIFFNPPPKKKKKKKILYPSLIPLLYYHITQIPQNDNCLMCLCVYEKFI